MRRLAVLAVLALGVVPVRAQELACQVSINRQSLSGNEYVFLDELEDAIFRYLNTRAWTDDVVENRERIDCSVQITLTEAVSLSSFAGQIVVQASRPIYGTVQRSTSLLLRDEQWNFSYTRGQSLIYDPNRFDALTSVLDFYANLILGYDYDSFSELGGTEYFERARLVAELGRSNASAIGWGQDQTQERSRYTLVEQLLDPQFEPLRRALFTYHYEVLDHFVIQPQVAWAEALAMFAELNEMYQQFNRRRYATDVFFGARYQEFVALMEDSPQRNEAYAFLSEMDAAHLGTYDALVNSR